jgi:Leucine-rich repeat (LRR) protein
MSIHHPFSASSKPLPNTDTEYWNRKTPLPFAATLNQGPLFGETQEEVIPGPSHRSPLKRKEGQGRQRRHRRSESNGSDTTCDSLSPTLTDRSLPSDDELKDKDLDPFRLSEQRIAECVFSDTPRLDLTGFGLDRLSDKVSDLRYISRLERKSVSLSDPSIGLKNLQSLGIGTPNSHSQKPFLRSASLPSPYLSQSTPNSPPPKSYSNPLGLGPPPSPQTRTLGTGGFYPPGSPVLEEGRVRKVPVGRNLTDGFGGRMRVRFGLAAGLRGELPPGSDREVREGEGESEDPFLVPRREGPARVGLGTPFLPSKSYGALPSSTITPSPSTTTTTASPSRTGTRSMTRTPSGFYTSQESPWVGKGAGDLELWLSRNRLDRLPSGLWLLTNLTVLSLSESLAGPWRDAGVGGRWDVDRVVMLGAIGDNQLDRLPAGIGQLERLTELNVSNNLIVSPLSPRFLFFE